MTEEQRLRTALEQVLFALKHYEHWKPSLSLPGEAPEGPEPREEIYSGSDPLYGKRMDSADMGEN